MYTDSSPTQAILSIERNYTVTVRTLEIQFRSIEEENRQGLDEICPLRLVTVYCLVAGETSPPLAVKVDIAAICYQRVLSASYNSTCTNCDVLMKNIKRPSKTSEKNSVGCRILDLPTTQAENP